MHTPDRRSRCRFSFTAALLSLSLSLPLVVRAGEIAPPVTQWEDTAPAPSLADDSGWQFTLSPYFYGTGLDGKVGVGSVVSDVELEFSDIWDIYDGGLVLALEGRKGRYGFMFDGLWTKLAGDSDTNRPGFTEVALNVEEVIISGYFTYRAYEDEDVFFDVMAGFRYGYLDVDIELKSSVLPNLQANNSNDWVDPMIGLRTRYNLTDKLFLNTVFQIGGFGISSDLTWDLYVGLGYSFTDWVAFQAGWRHISTDYDRDDFTYDIDKDGFVAGLNFTF